jgi:uncharacterized membrane protein
LSIAALLVSGFAMVLFGLGGFANLGHYINAMMAIGLVMIALFAHVYFAPWKRFRRAAAAADWATAERNIRQIRVLIAVNLLLGLATTVIGASGRYFG